VTLDVKKSIPVIIEFDPAFENNAFSRTARSQLVVTYEDHPHEVKTRSLLKEHSHLLCDVI
jgi:hypothetical protein